MNKNDEIIDIAKLRLSVGILGEKDQANWWPSLWFAPTAESFLSPIYGDRTEAARYHGIVEAARRVHDNRIGVGQAFHLFRLPETLERRLHDAVVGEGAIGTTITINTKEDAEGFLAKIGSKVEASSGPIRVGRTSELDGRKWLKPLAGHYLAAFQTSQQTLPYFAEGL